MRDCKHDNDFYLNYNITTETHEYRCMRLCGFTLPFDPDRFPYGVVYSTNTKPGPALPEFEWEFKRGKPKIE